MSTVPNTTPVPNILIDRYMPKLSDTAFRVAMIIVRKTYGWLLDPETGMRKKEDWIAYSQLMEFSGRERAAVSKSLRELESFGIIDIRDQKGNQLKTIVERRGKKLMYRFTTSSFSELVAPNQYEKRTSESEHTKETNTKVLSKDNRRFLKEPSCPLLNGSPLKSKYPNGHTECEEYFGSIQDRRGFKFINPAKQFKCIHSILKAEIGFDEMDTAFHRIEKKYGRGEWDFSTMVAWLEKGAGNAHS